MRQQAVELVLHRQVEVRHLLLGLGQALRDRLARRRQGNDLHIVRGAAVATAGSGTHVILGDAPAPTGTGHRVQVDIQFLGEFAHRGAGARGGIAGTATARCGRSGRCFLCSGLVATLGGETGNERIDGGIVDIRGGDNAQQSADRVGVAFLGNDPAQHPVDGGVPDIDDLVGLHLEDLIALGDGVPFLLVPGVDGPLDHLDAPLGHGNRVDLTHGYSGLAVR